jgi:diaminopimelate decarboxylase/aspartate kinase
LALVLAQVEKSLLEVRQAYPQLELWLEPGRFLVAQAGVLLAKVTQLKRKKDYTFVGVDVGMYTLCGRRCTARTTRSSISRRQGRTKIKANIVGPICETGDVLGHDRLIAEPTDGHVFLVATVGA